MSTTSGQLTQVQRAAAVIVALGAEQASEVYKYLREDEVEQLSVEIAKMERMSPEDLENTMEDFYGLCVTKQVISEGGVEYAKDVLEKAFGAQQATAYMERVSKSIKTKAFDFVRKADSKNLLNILQNEHPQTIALVLSYARADQASYIIAELPSQLRIDVIERIAKLDRASPEILNIVENTLSQKVESIVSVDLVDLGGVNYIADIMNYVDRSMEKKIFDDLNMKDPILADDIRKLMFVFEDIAFLDEMSVQRFIRDTDTKDLAVALKGATQDVQSVFFKNMSKRMAETVQSDMDYLHNVRMSDVEQAQQRIVAIIRKLEEEGEIVISKGGKDEVIA